MKQGQTISHYKILGKLGQGGMGIVYRAEDLRLQRPVALKFLTPDLYDSKQGRSRFIREARAAASLDHPNICAVYEIDEVEGQAFIAMPIIDGPSLRERLAGGPLQLRDVVTLAVQITAGLGEAHKSGIVHRDIKPANILLSANGLPKIMDFGLARVPDSTHLTRKGAWTGTAAYMAPEQVLGQEVSPRVDVWSLGVLLYELTTGELPFKGDHMVAIAHAITHNQPTRPRTLRADISPQLEQLILRCLSKSREHRPADALEVHAALLDLQNPSGSMDPTQIIEPVPSQSRFPVRRLAWIGLGILVIAAAVMGTQRLHPTGITPSAPLPVAVLGFENLTGDETLDYLGQAVPNLLITSLEQSAVFRVTTIERLKDLARQFGHENVAMLDREVGFELCRLMGVETVITGSYTKAGATFAIDAKVLDARSKELVQGISSSGEGPGSILREQIDEISSGLIQSLPEHRTGSLLSPQPIASVTTKSIEAYGRFIEGREAFNRFTFGSATRAMQEAAAIDPEFAGAYLYLAMSYAWLHDTPARNAACKRAYALIDHASRKEQLYIRAIFERYINSDSGRETAILEQLVARYPDEKMAHRNLAVKYRAAGDLQRAIAELEHALELDPNFGLALNSLAYTYIDLGEYSRALEYFQQYAAIAPNDANPYDSLGDLYFRLGQLDKAAAQFHKAAENDPSFSSAMIKTVLLHAMHERYDDAMEWIKRQYAHGNSPSARGHAVGWEAYLLDWQGRKPESVEQFRRAEDLFDLGRQEAGALLGKDVQGDTQAFIPPSSDWRRILTAYTNGDLSRSKESADGWLDQARPLLSEGEMRSYRAWYKTLRALIAVQEGNLGDAKHQLGELKSLAVDMGSVDGPPARFLTRIIEAEILLAEGNPAGAIRAFTPALDFAVVLMHDLPLGTCNSAPRDVTARAYLALGDVAHAIREYERLTSADPNVRHRLLIRPQHHFTLAKLYEQVGRIPDAMTEYERFLKITDRAEPPLANALIARQRLRTLRKATEQEH